MPCFIWIAAACNAVICQPWMDVRKTRTVMLEMPLEVACYYGSPFDRAFG
ncbi:hypothetical protein F441_20310 [Phytophthora nicotianae CJ01A1]|uniref:Uncharacterized protein n=3 Tax=Phytophthora nicotianae TaxID=4792 RepID=W2HZA8_PHYNI|nr:hypothetical protein L915_19873 [Phytophthora nicotianae]ETL26567.1 hypothetical protein L916_19755 [Phytophthora nicotianae]ETO61539.1 hypothetical protein F444_20445 [Phytophthora nicotianae P1976]ETP02607.1 hypothetical protein F441_20310 [Phytophthora nicotianae CJ01A1]